MSFDRMANARLSDSGAPESIRAPLSSITRSGSVCLGCGQDVDPLRAGHVAILEGRFRYFCRGECKREFLRAQGRPQEEEVATARPPPVVPENGSSQSRFTSPGRPELPVFALVDSSTVEQEVYAPERRPPARRGALSHPRFVPAIAIIDRVVIPL